MSKSVRPTVPTERNEATSSKSSPAVSFVCNGSPVVVHGGETFTRPPPTGFSDASEDEMRAIIAAIESGVPWRDEIQRRFSTSKPWLSDIILSPKRQLFFSLLPSRARRILDVGCGWGQMTLPLAERGLDVVAIEPGSHRLSFVRAAAKQNKVAERITFIGADHLSCAFEPVFDAILCIGVLEWIGAFDHSGPPLALQRQFLAKVRRELAPGGSLVLGIENRTGAKYLLGCPDDHLGLPDIACLPASIAAQLWKTKTGHDLRSFTFSDFELSDMLTGAGFTDVRFFGAFPDYKLPESIISLAEDGRELNKTLRSQPYIREHNGFDGSALEESFHARLSAFYQDTTKQEVAHHFVPSFFVVAR